MKINKMTLTVESSKEFRAQRLEGESEGKLGKELRVKGNVPIAKLKGIFETAEGYRTDIESMYNEAGELVHPGRGKTELLYKGRACTVKIEYALTDTHEFEDCTFDCVFYKLDKGGVAKITARLRMFPDNKQAARIPHWLKNEIKLTLNGETITAEDSEDDEQPELPLGAGGGDDDDQQQDEQPPPAAPGEVLPGVPAAHKDSTAALMEAGVVGVRGAAKPSTAHGEVAVPGQRPPQRPRRRPGETTH